MARLASAPVMRACILLYFEKVDFTFTRETKTLNDIFFFGDAIISSETDPDRTIAFNFQYGNNYVRLIFYCYDRFVFKVEEVVK